ncbi:MAG: amidohydrolase family protein [Porticoccaceae bacterium]|jgi:N-acyl-D-aspartate/D-glutamate deacylase|nr:amidohydrolase family protein [Porticoccaceae bacterium]
MNAARTLLILMALMPFSASNLFAVEYDLVIANGRVIDPETSFDQIAYVGINDGSISAVSEQPLRGTKIIDAAGLVVAPGFIDVHSHTPTLLGQQVNLLDGITTQLDLEAGSFPVTFYGEHFRAGAQINYGSSVGHWAVRTKVIEGRSMPYIFAGKEVLEMNGPAWLQTATAAQIEQMRLLLNQGLDQGGLGIGVLLDYMTEAVSDAELRMLFEVASAREVPLYVHVRRGHTGDPAGLIEVIDLATETGAALFVCHITHNAMGRIGDWLQMIDEANRVGANITTETLSYAAGGTSISADVFRRRDWRAIFDISYEDVQWVATGEWLTQETWEKYATEQPSGMVNHHYVKEEWVETALQWPGMMVSTDALPAIDISLPTNPNVAGTFSRVLGHYVRDRKVLELKEALAKLSLFQAQWMEQASPAFKKKGRIQQGADADIVIFDPRTVAANAVYGKPYLKPTGIIHVLVAGTQVVQHAQPVKGQWPGAKILGPQKRNF